MTKEQAKEFYPILQAFINGKEIEVYSPSKDTWIGIRNKDEIYLGNKYRIKPEQKYRPFANAEECWKEMQKHQPFGWLECVGCRYNIVSVSNIDVSMANVSGDIVTLRFCEVMGSDTFADGTPFGVKEEE